MAGNPHGGGGLMRWLLTYADMITLLMIFFIVLFTMANIDKQRYARLASSLQMALGGGSGLLPGEGGGQAGEGSGTVPVPRDLPVAPETPLPRSSGSEHASSNEAPRPAAASEDPFARLGRNLAADFAQDGRFVVYASQRGVVLSMLGSALFDTGQAVLKPEAKATLHTIALRLRALPYDISVEGSADDRPIHNAAFPSNWELSTRRATEVVRYLVEVEGLDPRRFLVVGYAEYRPAFDNRTPDGRARNRRVDIVVLRDRVRVGFGERVAPPH